MSSPIRIDYNKNYQDFHRILKEEIQKNPDYDLIIITNIPTIDDIKNLHLHFVVSSSIFQNFFGMCYQFNEIISKDMKHQNFQIQNLILIAFQSTINQCESKTFWNLPGNEKVYSLYIDKDETREVTLLSHHFLMQQLKNGNSGFLRELHDQTEIRLDELMSNENENLLMFAARSNQNNVIQELLKHDFDVNTENHKNEIAIDYAWMYYTEIDDEYSKNLSSHIILQLLTMNSDLPLGFNYSRASPEIQKFIDMCESVHKNLDDEDFVSLNEMLSQNPNQIYFFDLSRRSLLSHALSIENINDDVILNLLSKRLNFGPNEELKRQVELKLQNLHKKNSKECPALHILKLRSQTKIGNNQELSNEYWNLVDDAYKILDCNKLCSKMLKVAAACKHVILYFDFKHDTVHYMDPTGAKTSKGRTYLNGIIYIGAKYLKNEQRKYSVLGCLAHELCHVVMLLTFFNPNFDPFPMGESPAKNRYLGKVKPKCINEKDKEEIVSNVFRSYSENLHDSELIVTVPQMLMHYFENEVKLHALRETFNELFAYVQEIVEPELDRVIEVTKLLNDKKREMKFKNLTDPMKARISHKIINFQGQETTFHDLIDNDAEILDHLTSENIRHVFKKFGSLNFSEICMLNVKHEIVDRRFKKEASTMKARVTFYSLEDQKLLILSAQAGSGKTTSFISCAIKLKINRKNFWVSCVNLRKQDEVFEKFQLKLENLSYADFIEILLKMVNAKTTIEKKIFIKLLETKKVILLFDGVDEVSPKYSSLLLKILQIWNDRERENQLWLSTRPHYAEKLKQVFGTKSVYNFFPYGRNEIERIIKNILMASKIMGEKFTEISTEVKNRLFSPQSTTIIDNPLIVVIITELYIDGAVNFDLNNHYALYTALINKQKQKIGDKIPHEDLDVDINLTIWQIHQILALILIIGRRFEQSDLRIVKSWQQVKQNFTADAIQRYGLVNVDLEHKGATINFVHRSIAEFFVAQFLINSIFNDNHQDSNDEVMKKCLLLHEIISADEQDGYDKVREFILSFIQYEGHNKILHEVVRDSIIKNIPNFFKTLNFDCFKNYCKIASIDSEVLKKLWKIDEKLVETNLLSKFFNIYKKSVIEELVEKCDGELLNTINLAESLFGSNWHERFNRTNVKLIKDEEISSYKERHNNNLDWIKEKNLLKLCDLADKSFDVNLKRVFYEQLMLSKITNSQILMNIISRLKKSIGYEETTKKILQYQEYEYINIECIKAIYDDIENNIPRKTMRKLLWLDGPYTYSPFYYVFSVKNSEKFIFFKNFYIKYRNSWQEIQNIILSYATYFLLQVVASPTYPEFKEFINEAFGTNKTKIQEKIEAHLQSVEIINEMTNMRDFLLFIFSNNESKVNELMKKFNENPIEPTFKVGNHYL